MPLIEALRLALQTIVSSKLRSFFTLLGIIVSVGFLVVVVAIIQGMNSYIRENLTGAMIGTNAFQVRRNPIQVALLSDSEVRAIAKRPRVSRADAEAVEAAIPDARAVALQSGWPTPRTSASWRNVRLQDIMTFGVTPPYLLVQDYEMAAGEPLTDPDVRERRLTAVLGYDVAEALFGVAESGVGQEIRVAGRQMTVKGVIARKGKVLGQSFDSFILLPLPTFESIFGRRLTTVVSVKMATAGQVPGAMDRAEEAMRVAHKLRPNQPDDFTVDKADALMAFWTSLTGLLFAIIPAIVAIGIVVGGIVIMNIMLMSVTERTYEIGIRKALGARQRDIRRQFLVEAVVLSLLGGLIGIAGGWGLALLVSNFSPLPARVTAWSVALALALGAGTGIVFGVYPAARAARLDPITALRAE